MSMDNNPGSGSGSGSGSAGGSPSSTPVDGHVHVYGWQWGRDEDRRPGLPWIGVFLVIFGALLIVQYSLPDYQNLGNTAVLAAGLAFLLVWLLRRGTVALYLGAFLTAAAIPGMLRGLDYDLGVGWGTQAIAGAALVLLASSEIAVPDVSSLVVPGLLVVLGVILLVRGRR